MNDSSGDAALLDRPGARLADDARRAAAVTVVIPAFNEQGGIAQVLQSLRKALTAAGVEHELLVVDDGSSDQTLEIALAHGAAAVRHPQNLGYGRSLKTGIEHARHDLIAITDADGTYPIDRLPELIALAGRYHMVVGQRTGKVYQGGLFKRLGRSGLRWLSEFATGRRIPDINSGMRVFRRSEILPFFPSISTGFSFTTTVTLVYLLNEMFVHYVPIPYERRDGVSKVRYFRDTLRALQIVLEAILRYNPVKVFLLLALPFAVLALIAFCALAIEPSWGAALVTTLAASAAAILASHGFLAVALAPERPRPPRRSLEIVAPPSPEAAIRRTPDEEAIPSAERGP